jgi:hypothetical protein
MFLFFQVGILAFCMLPQGHLLKSKADVLSHVGAGKGEMSPTALAL